MRYLGSCGCVKVVSFLSKGYSWELGRGRLRVRIVLFGI